jgi:hypothetical protein
VSRLVLAILLSYEFPNLAVHSFQRLETVSIADPRRWQTIRVHLATIESAGWREREQERRKERELSTVRKQAARAPTRSGSRDFDGLKAPSLAVQMRHYVV